MESSTIIQLRKKLESLKEFQRLNAPSKFSYFGYLGEFFIGGIILGQLVMAKGTSTITKIPPFVDWILFVIALVLMFHALYLIFRYHSDRRLRKILEMVLSGMDSKSDSAAN